MKRVLITGCSGFLASFLIPELHASAIPGYRLYGFTEVSDFSNPEIESFHTDIRDRDAVMNLVKTISPDITFHLAAIANVGFSWQNQKLTYEINFIGSSNLLEALSLYAPHCRVLLMSSAELYCGAGDARIDESFPTSAQNPYSLSKKAMEMLADIYILSQKMEIIKLRSFNFTGPRQDPKFVASDFARQIAAIEKGKKEPVIRVGNLSAIRDISDVRDIARYLAVIAQTASPAPIYNLCSGQSYSISDILKKLLSLAQVPITVTVDESRMRPVDVPKLTADNRLIRETLQLTPNFTLEQTLIDLLNYWRQQESLNLIKP